MLAQSDDDGGAAKVRKQRAPRLLDGFVVGQLTRDKKTGFLFVANDCRGPAIGKQARGFGLDQSGHAAAVALLEHALGQRVGDHALIVIGEHQDIEFWQAGLDAADERLLDRGRERVAMLAIHAHNLLVAGDDARLYGGRAAGVADNSLAANFKGDKRSAQVARGIVGSGHAEQGDPAAESGEICGNISGAAGTNGLGNKINHGHRGFRRKTRRRAPDVAVEHKVADDSGTPPLQAFDKAVKFCQRSGFGQG